VAVICKVSFLEFANLDPVGAQEIRTTRGPISADQQFRGTVSDELLKVMTMCSLLHLHGYRA
jgi:hypothetical protein